MHPARKYTFDMLVSELEKRVKDRLIVTTDKCDLRLYNYTDLCTYERKWDDFTLMARGLILDLVKKEIVATPFSKFFNYGEMGLVTPDLPFEAYEKLDGSMVSVFYHDKKWQTATRGSFYSNQAKWAQEQLDKSYYSLENYGEVKIGDTLIFEAIYPSNKIVVKYNYEGLVLLGGYDNLGEEIDYGLLTDIANMHNWSIAKRYSFYSFTDILSYTPKLTQNEEGFVVKFSNGLRLKIKGEEYKRIHKMVCNLTPLAIWEAMLNSDDLEIIRKEIPEEFLTDFDLIYGTLTANLLTLKNKIETVILDFQHLTVKQIGLETKIPSEIKSYLFNFKNLGDPFAGKGREKLFTSIRPNANVLSGYNVSEKLENLSNDN